MKRLYINIISAVLALIVAALYFKDLIEYGLNRNTAVLIIIALAVIVAFDFIITKFLSRKIESKDDSSMNEYENSDDN